jgi:hypothetical protein
MHTPSRAAPHVLLGILTLLSAGAIWLSLATAPANAPKQLQAAADNTASVSSFIAVYDFPVVNGTQIHTSEVTFTYQAPDRIQETGTGPSGQPEVILVVGSQRYVRIGTGPWHGLAGGSSSGTNAGRTLALRLLSLIDTPREAQSVTRTGDTFAFTLPSDATSAQFLQGLLGLQQAQLSGAPAFQATVTGEYMTAVAVSAQHSGQQLAASLRFRSIGSAPALAPPPPSQVQAG